MTAKVEVAAGQTFIEGRSEAKARELLTTAKGREAEVLTTSFGYIVPTDILSAEDKDEDKDEDKAEKFDPSAASVAEVQEYLEGADEDERKRVLDAEAAGKNRVTITGEGAK